MPSWTEKYVKVHHILCLSVSRISSPLSSISRTLYFRVVLEEDFGGQSFPNGIVCFHLEVMKSCKFTRHSPLPVPDIKFDQSINPINKYYLLLLMLFSASLVGLRKIVFNWHVAVKGNCQ